MSLFFGEINFLSLNYFPLEIVFVFLVVHQNLLRSVFYSQQHTQVTPVFQLIWIRIYLFEVLQNRVRFLKEKLSVLN